MGTKNLWKTNLLITYSTKRFLSYIKATSCKGLFFKKNDHLLVEACSNEDWAGSINDRRSTTCCCTFWMGDMVTWRSKNQQVVSRSSIEAEFRLLVLGIYKVSWIINLLKLLRLEPKRSAMVSCDNKATISFAHNPFQHNKTKCVQVVMHFR